ncbi:MAG TPA: N-acetyltransferase [Bacteroidales bacterium]|nr:N-acetyltransferase [Bacteroidales bacterium]
MAETGRLEVRKVGTRKDLKRFIAFQNKLYRGNRYWCPPLRMDEMNTLSREKNPAFDFCEAEYWMAWRGNEPVGRIAGIINHKANDRWNEKLVRFGWIDFIDDPAVSAILIDTIIEWGRSKGMNGIHGPLGFSDMDNEGMLIKGFEELATLASIYNYPYYVEHMERLGFAKAADWVQYEFGIPPTIPDKVDRLSQLVQEKYHLRILKAKKAKELLPYAPKMFNTLNAAFNDLYGYTALTQKQVDTYIKAYFGFIRPEFVSFVLDEQDEVVGFGVSMPSLTKALQKCDGKLFPFGFIYLLRAMKNNDTIDMYLNGVRPDFHGKGINALYYNEMHKAYIRAGIKKAVTNPQLEDNAKALTIWKNFDGRQHLTRRCWIRHF